MQSQFPIPRSSPFPNHQQHPDLNICFSLPKKSSNIVILCVRRQHRSVKVFDENWNNALLHQEQPTQLSLSHFTIPQQKLSCSSFQHCIYCWIINKCIENTSCNLPKPVQTCPAVQNPPLFICQARKPFLDSSLLWSLPAMHPFI